MTSTANPGTAARLALARIGAEIPPPTMRLVHQGWLAWAERPVSVGALERLDRLRGRLRGRPWWRGLSARWRRI